MLPEKQDNAFGEFYKSARYNKILDQKTTLLIHLATAMSKACYPLMESYLGVAKKKGITDEEIGAVQAIVMAVEAGRVRAQFREVRDR